MWCCRSFVNSDTENQGAHPVQERLSEEHIARAWRLSHAGQLHRDHSCAAAHGALVVRRRTQRRMAVLPRGARRRSRDRDHLRWRSHLQKWTSRPMLDFAFKKTPYSPSLPSRPREGAKAFGVFGCRRRAPRDVLRREAFRPRRDSGATGLVPGVHGQLHLPARRARGRACARSNRRRQSDNFGKSILRHMVATGRRVFMYDFARPTLSQVKRTQATGATSAR